MIGVVGVLAACCLRHADERQPSAGSGMDYSQFANLTEYMALISGRVYPTLGLQNLLRPRH